MTHRVFGQEGDAPPEDPLSDWSASRESPQPAPEAELVLTPGTMLAGRYRVVSPLGRGGMGEVYRADDTRLDQPVALKFLRGTISPELLARLYAEVRIGRQVSHPNVCRLYDIVEVEGQTFLAMEYVDGEDLASLLARIGRLPPDKALDIARDLCAGLAAVHDKGVVHRDLKPANVMIDGRGRARLTDFGLALALEARGPDTFGGTPAYMSPEQLSKRELTPGSDIYALGLLLYEMFSGRRFFDARTLDELEAQHRESKGPRLSSVARLLDPAVERVIARCLDEDPATRPASARALLAWLPGGDPLDAAVAAGETPSPEMVAAAAKVGDLSPVWAWTCLLAALVGLVLMARLYDQSGLIRATSLPKSPEVLAERAREIAKRLGYDDAPVDWAHSFEWDRAYLEHIGRDDPSPARWEKLRNAPLAPFLFYYRQSPRRLVAANRDGRILKDDPPLNVSGMLEVELDPAGRLTAFVGVPPQVETLSRPAPDPDWSALFQEAGLDLASFQQADPQWAAPVDSDRKAAWEGSHAEHPGARIRIEAAAYHGRPVWFAVLPPWAKPTRAVGPVRPPSPTPVGETAVWILAIAMPLGGVLLARRNLRMGRGDRKAAFGVSLFVFVSYSLARMFRANHVSAFGDELWTLIKVFAYPSFWALQVWILYLALEPYARRRWPHVLISWKRLLVGKLRDPLVGRDVLIGTVAGIALALGFALTIIGMILLGLPVTLQPFFDAATFTSLRQVGFRLFVNQFSAVLYALVFLFMLVLLRMVVRRTWLATALWCVLVGGPLIGQSPSYEWVTGLVRAVVMLLVLTRAGLLSFAVALFFMFACFEMPLTLDFSAWYATRALPFFVLSAGVALYGFHTSLAGKPALGRAWLED